jgi:hypothetical protein
MDYQRYWLEVKMLGKVWGMAITLISGMINGVRIEL